MSRTLISGDTQWVKSVTHDGGLRLSVVGKITSSGLTQEWKNVSPNKHRIVILPAR